MIALLVAAALAGNVDAAGLKKLVEAHHGKPVVLNLWATWCAPCVKEFPELVALARARPDVSFVSVSLDDPGDRAAVASFLSAQAPPFSVYLNAPGPDEPFINGLDPTWSGSIPATFVFNRNGKRAALLQGEQGRADVEKALARLSEAK